MTLDERPRAAWAWAAGLGAALLHLPSLAGPFLFDDAKQVEHWRTAALGPTLLDGFFHRGLSQDSYLANRALGGEDPLGFHLANLGFQVLAVAALFLLARALMRPGVPRGFPFLCAAWFSALPASCESVDYLSGRPGLMAAALALATAAWAAERARGGRLDRSGAWRTLGGVALGSLLAAGCKESGWMTPLLAALCIAVVDGRPLRAQARLWARPAGAGVLAGGLLGALWLSSLGRAGTFAGHPLDWMTEYWMDQVGVWGTEVLPRWVLPFGPWAPSVEVDLPILSAARQMAGGLVFGGLMLLAWLKRRTLPLAGAALGWMLLAALPSSLIPLADRGAERHGFLAAAGASLLVASLLGMAWAGSRPGRWVTGLLLACLALTVPARAAAWQSQSAFWGDALRKTPRKERAAYNYGRSLEEAGRLDGALHWYRRAALTDPGRAKVASALALCLARLGRLAEAAEAYARATGLELAAIRMGDQPRQHATLLAVDAHNRIRILVALGRAEEARKACAEALPVVGGYPPLQEDAKELGLKP